MQLIAGGPITTMTRMACASSVRLVVDWTTKAKREPYAHQLVGVQRITELVEPDIGRTIPGVFYLGDDMRLGKTKQTIDSAQVLFWKNEIDRVIVIAPAPVRPVWFDPEMGELAKHLWDDTPVAVHEYHTRVKSWTRGAGKRALTWVITNYEFLRTGLERRGRKGWGGPRLDPLLRAANERTLLVLDETSSIKSHRSLQTRAVLSIRRLCGRVLELNGTPIAHSPADLFSQFFVMDPRIIGCESFWQYRMRYAVHGGYLNKQVIGWRHEFQGNERCYCDFGKEHPVHHKGPNIQELQCKIAPYILRRIRSECLDLPPKLEPVTLTAQLKNKTWGFYKRLRDELIAWLSDGDVVRAAQAGNRVMRLSQVCSGFVSGIEKEEDCSECTDSRKTDGAWLGHGVNANAQPTLLMRRALCETCGGIGKVLMPDPEPQAVGEEKLKLLLNWLGERHEAEEDLRVLVWCRFRPELHRAVEAVQAAFPATTVHSIHGGQTKDERKAGLWLMHPDNQFKGPAILLGTLGTGSVGINLAGAHEVIYLSNDNSLFKRKQSEDRPHGPGQTTPVSYHDIIACGPRGQQTVDHQIVKNLHNRNEIANWTCQQWISMLREEK